MKAGDLVCVKKVNARSYFRTGLVIEKYSVEPYWKVQLLGTTDCVLVEPENIKVINEAG